ncbi:MAG: hypothetical protein WCW62_06755 [Bacteroidales bacterium]|jgi:hypothetical protein
MKSITRIWRTIALCACALLIAVVVYFRMDSATLSKTLDKERLEKESMLSENMHLSRTLEELRKDLSLANEKNNELIRIIDTNRISIRAK